MIVTKLHSAHGMKAVLIVVGLLIIPYSMAWAANPFKFEEFGWLVSDMAEMMLEHCRKRGTSVMNSTGILGPLSDAHNFRRACGQGLHGKPVPGEKDWAFYYARLSAPDGDQDFIGIQRLVHKKNADYSLVVAWETRRQIENGKTGAEQSAPAIVLFQKENELWQPVWNYANSVTYDWNAPWDHNQDPDWTALTISDLQGIKIEHITGDYPSVLAVLKDSRGMGFPYKTGSGI